MTAAHEARSRHRQSSHPQLDGSAADGVSVMHASRAYRDLVHALADSVVEYHAMRHGVKMVSHVNYSLQQRVQRQREQAVSTAPRRR